MAGPKTDAEEVAVLFPRVTRIEVETYNDQGEVTEQRTVVARELPVNRTGEIAQCLLPIWTAIGTQGDLDFETLLRDHYDSFVEVVAVATNTPKAFLLNAPMGKFVEIIEAVWKHNRDVFLKGVWPRVASALKAQALAAPGQTPSTPFGITGTSTLKNTPAGSLTPISQPAIEQSADNVISS